MEKSKFRTNTQWAIDIERGVFLRNLGKLGIPVKDPIRAVNEADDFFFDSQGLRAIKSLNETTLQVVDLMRQGLFWQYCLNRGISSIPTLEFIDRLGGILNNLQPRKVVEVGAGDGALSHYLNTRSNSGIEAFDDGNYGRFSISSAIKRFTQRNGFSKLSKPTAPLMNRWPYDSVQDGKIQDVLAAKDPDIVIASWIYNPAVGTNDDVKILESPGVKHVIWIGETSGKVTASEKFFSVQGWKHQEIADINDLLYTAIDGGQSIPITEKTYAMLLNHNALLEYRSDHGVVQHRQVMFKHNIQKGRVVVLSR
jgi:hypothetical protein